MRSLYVCYFGLREPLVQTQVLPYLRELAAGGVRVWLLTFEREAISDEWREEGIEWSARRYHKSVPLKLYDILAGALQAIRIVRKNEIDVIHARSHVAAAIGAIVKRFTRARLLFDVRGLLADEYADVGHWRRNGLLYRITKRVERALLRASDAFVVLTEKARAELFASETRPVAVIPCCYDASRFASTERDRIREQLGAPDRTIVVYVGSLGGMYLARETAELFAAAKECDPRVLPLVLTQSDPALIVPHLQSDYRVLYVAPEELPSYLAASDIGVSLVKPTYAKLASSPTKFGEYLASGLPVISTRGIGDTDAQIERERLGALLDGLDAASYRKAFEEVQALRRDPALSERCRAFAAREYELRAVGGARYRALYRQLESR